MRGIVFGCAMGLAACGGSTESGQPDDAGGDGSIGDSSGFDAAPDTRSDSTAGDATTDAPSADTSDATPPPVDAAPDAVRGDSGGGPCGAGGTCGALLKCCSGACIYDQNDPLNCGGCGIQCSGDTSMCQGGHCIRPTCAPACGTGSVCCDVNGPGPSSGPKCVDGPTCPIGCPLCA